MIRYGCNRKMGSASSSIFRYYGISTNIFYKFRICAVSHSQAPLGSKRLKGGEQRDPAASASLPDHGTTLFLSSETSLAATEIEETRERTVGRKTSGSCNEERDKEKERKGRTEGRTRYNGGDA